MQNLRWAPVFAHLSASTYVLTLSSACSLTGSVNLGKISILQLTLQPFDGCVLPTFISQRVWKLINIFFTLTHSLSLPPSGKYLFPLKWAWANLLHGSICCQLPIKRARTLKLIATPSSSFLLRLLSLSFSRNEGAWESDVCVWVCVYVCRGCYRKIKTYSREEKWWLRHEPKAGSPLLCLSTEHFMLVSMLSSLFPFYILLFIYLLFT